MSQHEKIPAGLRRRHKLILIILAALVFGYVSGRVATRSGHDHDHGASSGSDAPEAVQVWTCSMHPQIQMPRPGLCPICHMDLIPLTVTDTGGLRELVVSEEAARLMDIEVSPVQRKFVTAQVRMVGRIDYDETNLAYITAWIPGRLDRLFVDFTGTTVEQGEEMVLLYSPELISAQEEFLQALATARNARDSDVQTMRRFMEGTIFAARERLRLLGLTEGQIAEIERTGEVQDHTAIHAPTGGIVIDKAAVEGMYVETGTRIYTIADLSRVWAILEAYESDVDRLRLGQQVQFTSVSYPGETFRGAISFIDPVLDQRTRTVRIRVDLDNPEGRLKPGMFVGAIADSQLGAGGRVVIADTTAEAQPPLVIPASAPLITGTRAVVYVRLPDTESPTFEGREVLLGQRAGGYYLVRSGLQEGELVVTRGNFKIDSAIQISGRPSMMTPDLAAAAPVHDHGHGHAHDEAMPETDMPVPDAVELPPLTAYQVRSVMAAADRVRQAYIERDEARTREAFRRLGEELETVDADILADDANRIWVEYRMRLRNDAIEGAEAKEPHDLERVVGSLDRNINAMAARFGLRQERPRHDHVVLPDAFRKQLGALYDAYIATQTALAADQPEKSRTAAENIRKSIADVNAEALPAEAREAWTKAANTIEDALRNVDSRTDMRQLREYFHPVSNAMIEVARRFGPVGDRPLYVAYCPMAFDDTGAAWLQARSEIRNPYFGALMLKCGEIKEVIGPRPGRHEGHGSHD